MKSSPICEKVSSDRVIIAGDSDETGLKLAKKAAAATGSELVLPEFKNPNGKHTTDFNDLYIIEGAEAVQRHFKATEKPDIRSAILETEDFLSLNLPEKTVYLDPWLVAQSILLVSGFRGTGKTWLALSVLMAITKKTSFGPWSVHNSVPCLYLDGEMAAQDVQLRAMQLDQTGEKENPLYIYSDAYASSLGLPRASLLNPEWRLTMKGILLDLGVKVWVVDNLASLTPGIDENSKKDWDPINNWLLDLRFAGITTILLHHVNKSGGQRGTSAREDNIDISIMLAQPPGYSAEDGASFVMSFTKSRVATEKLSKIADTQFRLSLDEDNKLVWTHGNVNRRRKQQVLILKDKDWTNKEIANQLGCSIQNVGQIVKRAQTDDLLTKDGKLTPSGFDYVNKEEK